VSYLMTDRGPNFEGTQSGQLIFPVPDFAPQIGVFRVSGETLVKEDTILLKDSAGNAISGLPNPAVGRDILGE
jgi:hypothetical protein